MQAYQGEVEDVLRDVLADVLKTDGINGANSAYLAGSALRKEARRLQEEGMIDAARRLEMVARAFHSAIPAKAAWHL